MLARGSKYNTVPEVLAQLQFPRDVYIVDSTIRSLQSGISGGRQTARDLVDIGIALSRLGVRELIVNLSWKNGLQACEGLAGADLAARIVGTFRARHSRATEWANAGIGAGVDEICFESCEDGEHLSRLAEPVLKAGKRVSHAFAEAFTYDEIVQLCRDGTRLEVGSQSFHDSFFGFGITPEAIKYFYRSLRRDVAGAPPLYVHLSNFYGNATMTAVAALTAGANAPDVCMNGVGHHCGHISLAEVTLVLEALYDVRTGIRLEGLRDTSLLVRERTGIPVSLPSPVIGDCAFLTDGAYWAAEANMPFDERVHATFPLAPEKVGNLERVIWSDSTVTADSVRAKLRSMGLSAKVPEEIITQIVRMLEDELATRRQYPRWLPDEEFEGICRKALSRVPSVDPAQRPTTS